MRVAMRRCLSPTAAWAQAKVNTHDSSTGLHHAPAEHFHGELKGLHPVLYYYSSCQRWAILNV
jgi:hypothetical protein